MGGCARIGGGGAQAVSSGIFATDSSLLSANSSNGGGGSSDSAASESFALAQPALIPSGLTLKDYQLAGISWLNLLRRHGLGGILADEMVRTRKAPYPLRFGFLHSKNMLGTPRPASRAWARRRR